MRYTIFLFFFLASLFANAQVSVKRDTSNAIVIVRTVAQPDGSIVTLESPGLDSTTAREQIFRQIGEAYANIARLADELNGQNKQASVLRNVYAQFDTTTYTTKMAAIYASSIYGKFTFKQDNVAKNVELKASASGSPIAQTGTTRGKVLIYAPNYIEIRNYFKTSANVAIDVWLCKKGDSWVTSIDGKEIRLRPQK